MRYNVSTLDSNIDRFGDWAIEVEDSKLIFYRKSMGVRIAFGALGNALAHGKEVAQYPYSSILSYKVEEKTFSNSIRLNFKDGKYILFKANSELTKSILDKLPETTKQM